MKKILLLGALSAFSVMVTAAAPETRFVRNQPSIPLVSEPGPEAVIIKRLTPGEAVTVIGEQGNFVNVTAGGTDGWIQATDLTTTQPPALRLETELEQARSNLQAAQERESTLENEIAGLQQQLRTARANARNAEQSLVATESSQTEELNEARLRIDQLETALEQSQDALEKAEARLSELEMARSASQLLARSPARSGPNGAYLWNPSLSYAIGASFAALLLGLLLGIYWRNRQLKKRYSGMEL